MNFAGNHDIQLEFHLLDVVSYRQLGKYDPAWEGEDDEGAQYEKQVSGFRLCEQFLSFLLSALWLTWHGIDFFCSGSGWPVRRKNFVIKGILHLLHQGHRERYKVPPELKWPKVKQIFLSFLQVESHSETTQTDFKTENSQGSSELKISDQ